MAWLKSHQELANHPKLLRLARALDVNRAAAVGHLHLLWWWAIDYAPSGDLSEVAPLEIAHIMDFPAGTAEAAQAMVESMVKIGWLDGGMRLHNWDERAGWIFQMRDREASRKRGERAQNASPEDVREEYVRTSEGVLTLDKIRLEEKREEKKRGDVHPTKRFQAPTPEEVEAYGTSLGYCPPGLGVRFVDFYASKGWKVGNSAMKDWKAAVRTWRQRDGGATPGAPAARRGPRDVRPPNIPSANAALAAIEAQAQAIQTGKVSA